MPTRPPTACRSYGCGKTAEDGKSYCSDHKAEARENNAMYDRNRDKKIRALYNSTAWHTFRLTVLARNPICQRLIQEGLVFEQCRKPAKIVHHVIDPKTDPSKFLDWRNVLAVCADHHPGGQEGEDPRDAHSYVDSVGLYGVRVSHRDTGGRGTGNTEPQKPGLDCWLDSLKKAGEPQPEPQRFKRRAE